MLFDPTFIFLIPAVILAAWAQGLVSSRFNRYSKVRSTFGISGGQLARHLLDNSGLYGIKIEKIQGKLTDHYDPRSKVVRLSSATYESSSIASLGVVAHEIGHAIQDEKKYAPLVIRNTFVPAANIGSTFSWIIFFAGLIFLSPGMIRLGIILFSAVVIFTLITLPVEFDASKRAKKLLDNMGMSKNELAGVSSVLSAAAMTYVASTAMALLQLLRMIAIGSVFGDRR